MSEQKSFDDILNAEIRWPRQGDKLFQASPEREKNAFVGESGGSRLTLMALGYKNGADLMVSETEKSSRLRDTLVYPIVFNYRQFIELSLKELIARFGSEADVKSNWTTHDLAYLWHELEKVLAHYGVESDKSDPVVKSLIAEFAKVDPNSYAYRYPVDREGKPLQVNMEQLDLAALKDGMAALENYFAGTDGYLDHLKDAAY